MPTLITINDAPDEILIIVFLFLEPLDVVQQFSFVNHQWRNVIRKSSHLWREFCLRTWSIWSSMQNISLEKSQNSTKFTNTIVNVRSDVNDNELDYPFMYTLDHNGFYTFQGGESFWARIFVERHMKDMYAIKTLHKTAWNIGIEHQMIEDVVELGVDVFETLRRQISPDKPQEVDLTFKYFATRAIYKIHNGMWLDEWKKFSQALESEQENDKISMLDGAILFCKKNIFFDAEKEVYEPLHQLTSLVKQEIGDCNDPYAILSACIKVMSDQGFKGDTYNYYNVENCYVNETLRSKTGIPITLCAIYDALVRQFGIKLDCIATPCHFLMRYGTGHTATYIDAFHCRSLSEREVIEFFVRILIGSQIADTDLGDIQRIHEQLFDNYLNKPAKLQDVFQRMLNNILTYSKFIPKNISTEGHLVSLLSLSLFWNQDNHKDRISRLEEYLSLGDVDEVFKEITYIRQHFHEISQEYNANTLTRFLNQIERASEELDRQHKDLDPNNKPQQKPRPLEADPVRYKVGDIILHKRFGYHGVIFGYDPICEQTIAWQRQMGVSELAFGANQPFYNVLVERDQPTQMTYVAQENIQCLSAHGQSEQKQQEVEMIKNGELGRYFERFDRQHYLYIPNEYSRYVYPDM